ncbi:ATP-binding cassette domain-containing protein [Halorubrum cibi]|uniref:Cobalamin import ATP-binding protein BtuD n=1 Tax=Halorubrum cibi TaxID=413815 RepID=A0A521D8R0_9EURY|nr:ATP-binding cassette domain-containing protein [Halorubrum cibi]SMO67471.1 iron complex transport system ATP-binding protein [Halorubrum cibi]
MSGDVGPADDATAGVAAADDTGDGDAADRPSAGGPLVAVRDLTVSFGDIEAVSGVDLTVERGTLVGLVGPNGAGKTTALRAITGALEADEGDVRLDGDPTSELSAREVARRVASVPQETGLSFDFPVRHVVEMGRTPYLGRFDGHDAEDAAAVDEAMAAAGVERFADRSITEVSGGERQRVLLARALAQETPTLLLDEPTASLDVNHAVATMELVRDIADDGRAAIAAIHDLDMAARYCDRIVVIAGGRVRADGPPADVLDAAAVRDAFDAEAFVGRNPATGTPAVTAFPRSEVDSRRVHVVGTGPDAARVVARLAAAGHETSLGVVPEGDAAAVAAADASARVVTVPPFAGVDDESLAAASELAADADVAVVVGGDGGYSDGTDPYRMDSCDRIAGAVERVVEVPSDVAGEDLLAAVADATA